MKGPGARRLHLAALLLPPHVHDRSPLGHPFLHLVHPPLPLDPPSPPSPLTPPSLPAACPPSSPCLPCRPSPPCLPLSLFPAGLDTSAKARHVIALIERLRSQLAGSASSAIGLLQPTAGALGSTLQVDGHWDALGPVGLLAEEVVRGSAAAALSLLLSAIEPR